jgi:cytochrome c oxidase assembly protein subunit 15
VTSLSASSDSPVGTLHVPEPRRGDAGVQRWLLCVWALVFMMVLVGGITRLTGSGLSITRWQPITGILPPLSEDAWQAELAHYRQSPQFREVNAWMQLADFKRIYFWEYVHRLLGRLIGFAVLVPWLVFLFRKRLRASFAWKTAGVFVLGGMQGALGWYMVKSGLIDEPQVSHFRLAAHLLLAFLVGQLLLWLALDVGEHAGERSEARGVADRAHQRIARATWVLIAFLALQTLYGAFMAGLRAGYYFGTFPDMNGHFAPTPFFKAATLAQNLFSYPPAVHWIHRALAFLVLGGALALWIYTQRSSALPSVRRAAMWLAVIVFAQLNLGAITVLSRVQVSWAVAHQGLAYLLLSAATLLLFRASRASRAAQ